MKEMPLLGEEDDIFIGSLLYSLHRVFCRPGTTCRGALPLLALTVGSVTLKPPMVTIGHTTVTGPYYFLKNVSGTTAVLPVKC
jgi:hypothetical protein